MQSRNRLIGSAVAVAGMAVLLLQGCATPSRLTAVPPEATARSEVAGMAGVRYTLPEGVTALVRDAQESLDTERKARSGTGDALPPADFLAISGGGDNGAFTAGILCGWTAAGNRPQFKLVTGVSTGALIAPLAFLGAKYDALLRDLYTNVKPSDILEPRSVLSAIYDDALADNAPLRGLIRKTITEDMLRDIAQEHAKGRILLVGTTNLDARRPVIWNLTKLAASSHPRRLELFQDILAASSAIPAAFPPVMIEVESGGARYHEMHVDGGAMAQVFVYPPALNLKDQAAEAGAERVRTLYLIRNSKVAPDWSEVERQTLSIAQRAVVSLIQTQGIGDLFRIYAIAQRDGVDYNLATIPDSFNAPHREEFDTEYMRALFDEGYERAVKGYPWAKAPPGM